MAKKTGKSRYFNSKFWRDTYVDNLDPSEKIIYIHSFTNPEAKMCGIYEIPLRIIASDTGLDVSMIEKIQKRFTKEKKMFYYKGWLCTPTTIKHQNLNNANTRKGIERELSEVPDEIMDYFISLADDKFSDMLDEFEFENDTPSKKPKTGKGKEIVEIEYPEWLNVKSWKEWDDYRRVDRKKKVTDRARAMQWKLLEQYSMAEQDEIINNSIINDYQGLFPLKKGGNNFNSKEVHVA